jgi:hypothetical protein
MYRKNTAGQFICVQLLLTATGAVATGLSPAARRCIDGTFAAGGGTFTEDGATGSYKYALAQADTNGNDISIIVTAAGAMPVCINLVTTAADPTDGVRLGLTALPNVAAGANGGLPTGDATGKVALQAGQVVGSVSGNVGGNVVGSVGSVVGLAASNLDATISSRMATFTYTTPDNASIAAIKAKTDNLPSDPADQSLLIAAIGAVTPPDNASIAAIKAKTDSLTFSIAGQADANIQYVNNVLVNGTGAAGNEWGP